MSIIETLKDIIGYSGTDLDSLFVVLSLVIVMMFLMTLFTLLNSFFKRRY